LKHFLSCFSELTDLVLENVLKEVSQDTLALLSPHAHSLKSLTLSSECPPPVRALDFTAFTSLTHLGLFCGFVVELEDRWSTPPVNGEFVTSFPVHVKHLVITGERSLKRQNVESLRNTLLTVMQHKARKELSLNLISFIHFSPEQQSALYLPSGMGVEFELFSEIGYVSRLLAEAPLNVELFL
jgi:hypothetical protein